MSFEWNESKCRENLDKHGIDFVRAAKIFRNPVFEAIDDRGDYGEERIKAIGQWKDDFFVVVYTWRESSRRIISAWKAGHRDSEEYRRRRG